MNECVPIKTLIVDDYAIVRQGLKMFLRGDKGLIFGEAINDTTRRHSIDRESARRGRTRTR